MAQDQGPAAKVDLPNLQKNELSGAKMTFPTGDSLGLAFRQIQNLAGQIKRTADAGVSSMASGDVTGTLILNKFEELKNADASMTTLAGTPGLAAYAKVQMDDPALDIVADYTMMQTSLDAVTVWIAANAGGQTLMPSMDVAGTVTPSTFTPAQTAGLRTVLQALSDTIG